MKNLTKTTLGIIAIVFISSFLTQCSDAKNAAVTKFLEVTAEQLNKQAPIQMGNGLTMEKVSVEENKTLKYNILVADEMAGLINVTDGKDAAINLIKGLPEFEQIKTFEVTIVYSYYDSSKKVLGEIKITPEDYK
ncbi:hypothetical protein [Dysgonomonas gadei]|uniref:Uncharacterized protein n=1 Tax=Dysgonomonas gadei ATCC BAA-286 TaxID=742766 RepID=F5IUS7_9BACT|nr:hypothetical protein [Dysgonomonas gadei]EGK02977.1 hypothetical protein HMPREF9455_01227 [Dysgonomonas gadei ATCC BAA-286]